VLHELTYALPRYLKGIERQQVGQIILSLVALDGVVCDKQLATDVIGRWQATVGLGFVDSYLAAVAARDDVPVFTKNVRDLAG
jgi:hypothetical protein